MKKTALALTVASLSLSGLALADFNSEGVYKPTGDAAVYGDYLNLHAPRLNDYSGDGVGVGFLGDLGVYHDQYGKVFGTFEYQYNRVSDQGLGIEQNQLRSGLGYKFKPWNDITFGGRVDYVHYNYETQGGGQNTDVGNSDGAGYHLNASYPIAQFSPYGKPSTISVEGGYIEASKFNGPEFRTRFDVPVSRRVSVFAAYQFDRYGLEGADAHYNYNDGRVGVAYRF